MVGFWRACVEINLGCSERSMGAVGLGIWNACRGLDLEMRNELVQAFEIDE
jgi:hypothetical protein